MGLSSQGQGYPSSQPQLGLHELLKAKHHFIRISPIPGGAAVLGAQVLQAGSNEVLLLALKQHSGEHPSCCDLIAFQTVMPIRVLHLIPRSHPSCWWQSITSGQPNSSIDLGSMPCAQQVLLCPALLHPPSMRPALPTPLCPSLKAFPSSHWPSE